MAPWKTRRVAADTRSLPFEAARWVDEQLAARVDGFGLPTIERLVALAAARFAPEEQAEKEAASRSQHHVTLTHPRPGEFAGTSWLEAAGDTQDLTAFYDLVCEEAKRLGRLGDTDDYETRKAKALGIIAARQGTLDLTGEAPDGRGDAAAAGADPPLRARLAGRPRHPSRRRPGRSVRSRSSAPPPSTSSGRGWHDSKATIHPVLDLNRTDAVDQHDPPPWMRELVILRDRHCVFPWCGRDARTCDLDHIVPYVPPDEGGPPGQTNPQNLAPLCRRHHRAKTFTGWTYQRARDGTYAWTSPHARTSTVGPTAPAAPPRPRPPRRTAPRRTPSPPDPRGPSTATSACSARSPTPRVTSGFPGCRRGPASTRSSTSSGTGTDPGDVRRT